MKQHIIRQRDQRKKRFEDGLCVHCDNQHRPNRTTCKECGKKASDVANNRHKERVRLGVCVECGGTPMVGLIRCQDCRDKRNKKQSNKRSKRYANGLCRDCGKNKCVNGKRLCSSCCEVRSKKAREKNLSDKRDVFAHYGS